MYYRQKLRGLFEDGKNCLMPYSITSPEKQNFFRAEGDYFLLRYCDEHYLPCVDGTYDHDWDEPFTVMVDRGEYKKHHSCKRCGKMDTC